MVAATNRRAAHGPSRSAQPASSPSRAAVTGGEFISEDLGGKLENVELEQLGQAKRIVVDKDNTLIVEGAGKSKEIEGRVKQLRAQVEETTSDYDREKLQERLAKLPAEDRAAFTRLRDDVAALLEEGERDWLLPQLARLETGEFVAEGRSATAVAPTGLSGLFSGRRLHFRRRKQQRTGL
jgi:hypothetical protein